MSHGRGNVELRPAMNNVDVFGQARRAVSCRRRSADEEKFNATVR